MKKILVSLLILFVICGCESKEVIAREDRTINQIDYSESKEFPFELNSNYYLLMRLNDFKVLYAHRSDEVIYPASLTKVVTLNTALRLCDDINATSGLSYDEYYSLLEQNASIAYLKPGEEYTVKDLLFALILPSGADAALAISDYYESKGYDFIEEMNRQAESLGLLNTHFVNTTGLHDDDHYTSLDDYLIYVLDTLKYYEGREVLETLHYTLEDGLNVKSTILPVTNKYVTVFGGKTGFTGEAGQCILVLYECDNRSYLLLLANAPGNPGYGEYLHYEDTIKIFKELYGNHE